MSKKSSNTKQKKPTVLANEIVVTIENEGTEDEYLQVNANAYEALEARVKKRGGIYVLKEEVTIEVMAKVERKKRNGT